MKLKEWFTDSSKWCQGYACEVIKGKITKCCLAGAVGVYYPSQSRDILNTIANYLEIKDVVVWNDDSNRTFDDIYKLVNDLDI